MSCEYKWNCATHKRHTGSFKSGLCEDEELKKLCIVYQAFERANKKILRDADEKEKKN